MPRTRNHLFLVQLSLALNALLMLGTSLRPTFFGPVGPEKMNADVRMYRDYAGRTLEGEVPYRDFLVEYPLLALPVFLLPALAFTDTTGYRLAFGVELLLFDAWILFALARRVSEEEGEGRLAGRLAWYTLAFATLCPLAACRYDLVPTALTFAATLAWGSGRNGLGGGLAAAGALMKIFPGAILAAAPGWERAAPRRGLGLVAFTITMALGVAAWLGLGRAGVLESLRYHTGRGLELGSTYSGLAMILGLATGASLSTNFDHSSMGMISPWSARLAQASLPLQVASLAAVAWGSWKAKGTEPIRWALAAILAFIAFGKVFSPQYLIWIFPFVAALPGWRGWWARWGVLAACLLTTVLYPWGINGLIRFDPRAVVLLNLRNGLVVGLWAWLTFGGSGGEIRAAARPMGDDGAAGTGGPA